jgi:hypothetical protein
MLNLMKKTLAIKTNEFILDLILGMRRDQNSWFFNHFVIFPHRC